MIWYKIYSEACSFLTYFLQNVLFVTPFFCPSSFWLEMWGSGDARVFYMGTDTYFLCSKKENEKQ